VKEIFLLQILWHAFVMGQLGAFPFTLPLSGPADENVNFLTK
jgi:hypothetical protein